ncbi:hypothetical protein N7519_005853 [Penicillium mononematosum]|uniref:uncharacterized protein n=1 Tax=Penicillium mononematosum TaxID=268346 RepID=UPI00254930A9|nr:uncharacterized protein N7519_005853 [Penicillium mononematosum]KAJ6184552.1 hypothetical protein N7519_005853 [Penicillium mononematosum]
MPRVTRPPVKAACLPWCATYLLDRSFFALSSYFVVEHRKPVVTAKIPVAVALAGIESAVIDPVAGVVLAEEPEPFLDNMIGLVSPFAGVHNLDLSPDSLSTVDGAHQFWGQLTPHDDSSYESALCRMWGHRANAYYIYIHPYLPLLPPPAVPQQDDHPTVIRPFGESSQADKSHMPYWPTSSLSLALSAMLVLIPTAEDTFPMAETNLATRRSYAQLFAQAALAAVETETDDLSPGLSSIVPGIESSRALNVLHPQVPTQLDPVLALVVLSIYEYCQRGNVSRMRARGNQAITTAMDISIHRLDSMTTDYSEAQRRAWWMTNIESVDKTAVLSDFGTRIRKLDSDFVSLVGEADRHLLTTFDEGPEASVAQTMWMISRMLIHAARTRLHRFRAFMDIPLFLDNYCDLAAINSEDFPHQSAPKWVTDREVSFPFTEQESSIICLKSSLVVTTIYRNLPYAIPLGSTSSSRSRTYPKTIPYFACSAMQSCYGLLMLLHRLRACLATDRLANCYHLLNNPTPASEIADAERLSEELRHGVEILGRSLKSDVIFEGVGGMGREIEGAYLAAFPNSSGI